ncbi:MAG TPA: FtsW/RodA/SpoVE family cell cycle protein [Candidatus Paceibacterota bacterium]
MWFLHRLVRQVDWVLLLSAFALSAGGLVTMDSFVSPNYFFERQLIWLGIALVVCLALSFVDFRFLRRSGVVVGVYGILIALLAALLLFGQTIKGAKGWFSFGLFSLQPADFMKLSLILILAKYFSRRHIEIAHFRHILVSVLYAFLPLILILFQPDFGSAAIIFTIWLGMIMVSGVSKQHLLFVVVVTLFALGVLWLGVFTNNQKSRIISFIHPLADIQGAGYNAFQSTIAVGSGQLVGKGVGFGTQSRLRFLPEFQTDFIFAAFAEEWGFIGVIIFFILFSVVIWRIARMIMLGATNFEILFGVGFIIFLVSHFVVNVGMNIGLLPVTGLTLPFTSYGGSHLLTEFIGLGILMGMRQYSRAIHRDDIHNEFLGGM